MTTHIVWDYNGTVLDDARLSVFAVNKMLQKRALLPTDFESYIETVALPLESYYASIGITDADMQRLSDEFRAFCEQNAGMCSIFPDFRETAEYFRMHGIRSILMSSLHEDYLFEEIKKYEIDDCFDEVYGLSDKSVGSKTEIAKKFIKSSGAQPENLLFVGDLINDARLAKELGARCVLIPRGHNSRRRCENEGVVVLDSIEKLKEYIQRA